jgi:hypothetical protein
MPFAHAIRNRPLVGGAPPRSVSTEVAQDLLHRQCPGERTRRARTGFRCKYRTSVRRYVSRSHNIAL